MRQDLEDKLAQEFSFMEGKNVWTDKATGYPMGCECDDGWFGLIYNMCKEINQLYIKKGADILALRVLQIKEKYSTLNVYLSNYIDGVDEIVDKYESLSSTTCEHCGNPGVVCIKGGWYKTLCSSCAKKQGFKICESWELY
jgi:hypothetical protein